MNSPRTTQISRRLLLGGATAGIMGALVARSSFAQESSPVASPTGETVTISHARGESVIPAAPQRVLALGDEFLLADLFDFGVKPFASSSTYGDHFIGLDDADTEGIETFSLFSADLEQFVTWAPDLIVAHDYIFDVVDGLYDLLTAIAPTVSIVVVTENWQDQYRATGEVFGMLAPANAMISILETEIESAAAELALEGQTVTVATVYPGDASVTLWLSPTVVHTEVLTLLGLTLTPSADDFETDPYGRAQLSVEQVNLIDGETLIMLQTSDNADEQTTLDAVLADPLWQTIPAVQNDRVFTLERVGAPGLVRGRRTILGEYKEIFGTA